MVDLTNIWLYRLHVPNLTIIYYDNGLYVGTKTTSNKNSIVHQIYQTSTKCIVLISNYYRIAQFVKLNK